MSDFDFEKREEEAKHLRKRGDDRSYGPPVQLKATTPNPGLLDPPKPAPVLVAFPGQNLSFRQVDFRQKMAAVEERASIQRQSAPPHAPPGPDPHRPGPTGPHGGPPPGPHGPQMPAPQIGPHGARPVPQGQPARPNAQPPTINPAFETALKRATLAAGIDHSILDKADKTRVNTVLPKILQECARDGVTDPARIAVMVANAMRESQLKPTAVESTSYSNAKRLLDLWPARRFDPEGPQHFVSNPAGLANRVYANRNGNGNEASGDGYLFRGRGLVQTTGRGNYAKLNNLSPRPMKDGKAVDFTKNPELAASEDLSIQILVQGMDQGIFTGSGHLDAYLNGKPMNVTTFTKARKAFVGSADASTVGAMTEAIYNQIKDIDFEAPQQQPGGHP